MSETIESRRKLSFGSDHSPTCILSIRLGPHTVLHFIILEIVKMYVHFSLVLGLKISIDNPVCGAFRKRFQDH